MKKCNIMVAEPHYREIRIMARCRKGIFSQLSATTRYTGQPLRYGRIASTQIWKKGLTSACMTGIVSTTSIQSRQLQPLQRASAKPTMYPTVSSMKRLCRQGKTLEALLAIMDDYKKSRSCEERVTSILLPSIFLFKPP